MQLITLILLLQSLPALHKIRLILRLDTTLGYTDLLRMDLSEDSTNHLTILLKKNAWIDSWLTTCITYLKNIRMRV